MSHCAIVKAGLHGGPQSVTPVHLVIWSTDIVPFYEYKLPVSNDFDIASRAWVISDCKVSKCNEEIRICFQAVNPSPWMIQPAEYFRIKRKLKQQRYVADLYQ